ncbi:MAG: glycosyltransferase, partial [Candidatus Thorarchaeota archaeon]
MNDYPIPSIFAVSLNWNGFSLTVPCVDSLIQSNVPFDKIIVLDQASTDGSGEKLRQLYVNDPQVDVICNEKNYGFAAGTNIGIRKALEMGAEFVFIVNNDTIVDKDCIRHLYKALSSSSLAGVAGPAIMYHSKPEKIWQAGGYFNKLKMGTSVPAKGKMYSEISHSISSVGFLTGCALLIPSQIFK